MLQHAIAIGGVARPQSPVYVPGQAVPTSLTVVVPVNCLIMVGIIANPTANPITFTMFDNQGTPLHIVPPNQIAGSGGSLSFNFAPHGLPATGGLIWQASAPGLVGRMTVITYVEQP